MCRMYATVSTVPQTIACATVRSTLALRAQSGCDYKGDTHPDGWGVGWYEGDAPQAVCGTAAAIDDPAFAAAAEHVAAKIAVAHVRKASVGTILPENTHPFFHGRWLFAHNGTVYEYAQLADRLAAETAPDLQALRRGTTDSEQMFYWLLSRLRSGGHDLSHPAPGAAPLAALVAAGVDEIIARARQVNPASETALNFFLTDGVSLAACRWRRTLWLAEFPAGHCCPECGRSHAAASGAGGSSAATSAPPAVAIASQPVSHDRWQELADGDVLGVGPDLQIVRQRLASRL